MKRILFSPIFALLLALFSFLPESQAEGELAVYVPVEPYQYLVERIGGRWVKVQAIAGEGDDCHNYSPSPRQVAAISRAQLLFSGGLGFEDQFYPAIAASAGAPPIKDFLEGIDLMSENGKIHAIEGLKHIDHDEDADIHVWLSPRILKQQAEQVAIALSENLPLEAVPEINANLVAFLTQLDEVSAEITTMLAPKRGQVFYVYHGAFTYFARDFEIVQRAIEIGSHKPTPKQVTAIAKQAKAEGVKTIFMQPQFDPSSAKSLAEAIDGRVEMLDPLEKDILANLLQIAKAIARVP